MGGGLTAFGVRGAGQQASHNRSRIGMAIAAYIGAAANKVINPVSVIPLGVKKVSRTIKMAVVGKAAMKHWVEAEDFLTEKGVQVRFRVDFSEDGMDPVTPPEEEERMMHITKLTTTFTREVMRRVIADGELAQSVTTTAVIDSHRMVEKTGEQPVYKTVSKHACMWVREGN